VKITIKDHYVYRDGVRVPLRSTPNRGGLIKPELVVLHDTAGRLDGKSSIAWMTNKVARASAHLFIDRLGNITQLAPFNIATWHAGKSKYKGRSGVNGFSIGIEHENPGKMTLGDPATKAKAWWGQQFDIPTYGIRWVKNADNGPGFWMPYPAAQVEASIAVTHALVAAYVMKDVTTHYAISPGRKVDVNPLFPLGLVRGMKQPMGRA
jgi:N-acetylmuramoyl-L-alanine amidase